MFFFHGIRRTGCGPRTIEGGTLSVPRSSPSENRNVQSQGLLIDAGNKNINKRINREFVICNVFSPCNSFPAGKLDLTDGLILSSGAHKVVAIPHSGSNNDIFLMPIDSYTAFQDKSRRILASTEDYSREAGGREQ